MSMKVDHKKQSKWVKPLNSHKGVGISLILIGVMGVVGEGQCTFHDELYDRDDWNSHPTMGFCDSITSLSPAHPLFDYGDDSHQDMSDVNFFNRFENDLEFLKEYGNFDPTSHQPQEQAPSDTAPLFQEEDEEQWPISELLAKFERESELEAALKRAEKFPTLEEETTHKRSLASDETIAVMEEKVGGNAESVVQNIGKSEVCVKAEDTSPLEGLSQSPDLSENLSKKVSSVQISSYSITAPASLSFKLSLKDQAGVLTGNINLEMSQKQALSYINDCLFLQRENSHGGGIGFTINQGRISAIRTYTRQMQ